MWRSPLQQNRKHTFLGRQLQTEHLICRQQHVDVLYWLWYITANSDFFYPRMHGDKDTYRLAFALANKASQYNQLKLGPQLGLTPWKRPEGLFYVSAGFVQPDFANATAFYHRVEQGAKLNPDTPFTLIPLFVTTTLSHTWRRPGGTSWFGIEHGGGGIATHYPASHVNTTAYQECCSSPASKSSSALSRRTHASSSSNGTFSSSALARMHSSPCSCRLTSSQDDHMMIAIPISYFPDLRKVISISQKIFIAYQHDLWLEQQTQS